jgi:predicted MFS family arabinose efflux permease
VSEPSPHPLGDDPSEPAGRPRRLSRGLVALLALTAGAAAANLYYIQPLLDKVAAVFHVSDGTAGLLVTCTQIGYVVGLALLVPLGDLYERRRLITIMMLLSAAATAACGAAPSFSILAAALVAVGVLAAVAQIVVPLSSALAAPQERGRVVGTVMSGLLIGILAARTLSGVIAEVGGWRLSFVVASGGLLALSVLLRYGLPLAPPTEEIRYQDALRSVLELIRSQPVLRQRMALGACGFASFSILWTSIAFLLGGSPYHYGEGVIGLFGLAGLAGALSAPLAGRAADHGHSSLGTTAFLVSVLASWGLLALGRTSLVALLAGIVLLDAGVQGAHILNQTKIYGLSAEARSRLTTAYMVAMFLGGVAGSLLSATVYSVSGWRATCALGAGVALLSIALWALTSRRLARRRALQSRASANRDLSSRAP